MASSPYFKLTTHFHWLALGGETWKHQVEAIETTFADVLPSDPSLKLLSDALVAFYQEICLVSVFIEKVVISTWFQDTDGDELVDPGYGANENTTYFYSVYGTRSAGVGAASLDVVLDCRKSVSLGHPGRFPIRGCLITSDFTTNAQGRRGLSGASPVAASGALWLAAYAHIQDFILGGGEQYNLSMLGERAEIDGITPETIRLVQAITPVAVRTIQLEKHR